MGRVRLLLRRLGRHGVSTARFSGTLREARDLIASHRCGAALRELEDLRALALGHLVLLEARGERSALAWDPVANADPLVADEADEPLVRVIERPGIRGASEARRTAKRTSRDLAVAPDSVPEAPPRRRRVAVAAFALLLVGVAFLPALAQNAAAWKPTTHAFLANEVLLDLVDDGMLTIDIGGTPHPFAPTAEVESALRQYPQYYRAGVLGPDAYPDIYVGQSFIHADTATEHDQMPDGGGRTSYSWEWLEHLWNEMNAYSGSDRLQVVAFTYGFITHAIGDTFSHTYVNEHAEGVFPFVGAIISDTEKKNIAIRHIALEAYIDKFRPPIDPADPYNNFEVAAPVDFILNTLVDDPTARSLGNPWHFDFFLDLKGGLEDRISAWTHDRDTQDTITVCLIPDPFDGCILEATVPDPTDAPAVTAVHENLFFAAAIPYAEAWVDDIDDGLRAWIETSTVVARELFLNADAGAAKDAVDEWMGEHLLKMIGFPDVVADVIDAVLDFLGFLGQALEDFVLLLLPDALEAAWNRLKTAVADFIFELAFGITFTELKTAIEQPETLLDDPALFPQGPTGTKARVNADMHLFDHDSNPSTLSIYDTFQFDPAYNTVVLSKLALLPASELNRLFNVAAGTTSLNDIFSAGEHVFLNGPGVGVIRSIDADHQWASVSQRDGRHYGTGRFRYWQDCVARDFVFREIFRGTFPEAGDPRTALSDTVAPSTAQGLAGPQYVNPSGGLFLSSASTIELDASDNFWTDSGKYPGLNLDSHLTPAGDPPGPFATLASAELDFQASPGLPDGDYVFEWRSFDKCENTEPTRALSFYLDNTAPSIAIASPLSGATYLSDQFVPLDVVLDDGPGAGVDPVSVVVTLDGLTDVNGQPIAAGEVLDIFLLGPGSHTLHVAAADHLGNAATKDLTFTAIATLESLRNNVEHATADLGMITSLSVENALLAIIDAAIASRNRGTCVAMHNQIDALIELLSAQSGGHVTPLGASLLIAWAQDTHNRPC